jgi:3-oxo-5-alpha-steroid 4-dehydrogenase 1
MSFSSSSLGILSNRMALPTTMAELSTYCNYFMIFMGVCMMIACTFKTAVYGRYSTSQGWGPLIKAKIAWIVMESPNLWISASVFMFARSQRQPQAENPVNILLLLFFFVHYIHRDLIFPFKMASCEPTDMPASVMLLAFVFCCFNGTTQALAIMYGLTYRYTSIYTSCRSIMFDRFADIIV